MNLSSGSGAVLVLERKAARDPSFEEVAQQVARDYMARKTREIEERLSRELMQRYQVEIVEEKAKEGS